MDRNYEYFFKGDHFINNRTLLGYSLSILLSSGSQERSKEDIRFRTQVDLYYKSIENTAWRRKDGHSFVVIIRM